MIKNWLKFLILSHLFLVLSAFIFSMGILKGHDEALDFSLALACAVFGIYNINRLNKLETNQLPKELHCWYEQKSFILRFTTKFSLFISAVIYMYLLGLDPISLPLFSATGVITILYIYSVRKVNLRQIPGTKALWISTVWTLIGVVIPKVTANCFVWGDLHYFILFYALTIPGDMRDSELDNSEMKTIPQVIGIRNANLLFYLLISLFLVFYGLLNNLSLVSVFSVLLIINLISKKTITHYRYDLMDGILLLLGVCSFLD